MGSQSTVTVDSVAKGKYTSYGLRRVQYENGNLDPELWRGYNVHMHTLGQKKKHDAHRLHV